MTETQTSRTPPNEQTGMVHASNIQSWISTALDLLRSRGVPSDFSSGRYALRDEVLDGIFDG